jgi:hypothetical protein
MGGETTLVIHTETQDGKSILDAHFARAMQAVMDWVRDGNSCITPTQATIGLSAHGGVKNSVVELVEHDRERLKALVDQLCAMEDQLKKLFSRANDILISFVGSVPLGTVNIGTYQQCPPFQIQVFEYSGIGDGVCLLCSPAMGTVQSVGSSNVASADEHCEIIGESDEDNDVDEDAIDVEGEQDGEENDEDVDSETEPESEEEITDLIQVGVTRGTVTGISVATQGQLRKRVRRWKRRPVARTTNHPTKEPVDIISSAVSKVMTMHGSNQLCVQEPSGLYRLSTADEDVRAPVILPVFLLGWAIRPKRGWMYGRRYMSFETSFKSFSCKGCWRRQKSLAQAG